MTDAAALLSAMIPPVVLIGASGTLIVSTAGRLGRASDRVRHLSERALALSHEPTEQSPAPGHERDQAERSLLASLAPWLIRRVRFLHLALLSFYVCVLLCVLSSVILAADRLLPGSAALVPAWLLLAGAAHLAVGAALLTGEAHVSWRTNMAELRFAAERMAALKPDSPKD